MYRLWEPLVRASTADLQNAVSALYNLAEDQVSGPLIAAHNPPLMQSNSFSFWYNSGSGWGGSTTTQSVTC